MKTLLSMAAAGLLLLQTGAALAETTLKVWDTFSDEKPNAGMQAFVKAFEAANPDIKIKRDVQKIDEMRPVIQTALSSGSGPDVFYYDTGPGFAGVLAKAGLIVPLDDLYASNLDKHVFAWTKERTRFDGKVYGVGNELEFVGVYYNQDLFGKLGLQAPTSYEDFVKVCEALKAAGKVPIAFGDKDGWPAFHIFSMYMNNMLGKEKLDKLLFGNDSWDDPAIVAGIKAFFVDANKAGYLIPSTTAVNYDDSKNLFVSGEAGMMATGTWLIADITDNAKFKPGWFFMPKAGGGDPLPPAGMGSGYFISAKSANQDAAKKFISFLFDPANAKYWAEGMNAVPPVKFDVAAMNVPPLYRFAVDALAKQAMGYNIDVLTPDKFNSTMLEGFQAVLTGQKSPEQQAKDLQAAMEASRK